MFDAAIEAALPAGSLAGFLPQRPQGRTIVVGAGKAAAAMAHALEAVWNDPLTGLVITRYGHGVPCNQIRVVEASHPVPDEAGRVATGEILDLVSDLDRTDLVIALISGGASALLTYPIGAITLAEKQAINRALLKSGAPISEMNCVRKHLSAIKGGRLAVAAMPARVVTLAISDVPGDDPATIGSGPTVPDPTTTDEAMAILERYGIPISGPVRDLLNSNASESPKPGDPAFDRCEYRLIATPGMSMDAAAAVAARHGYTPIVLGDDIEGESKTIAEEHRRLVRQIRTHGKPATPPVALISGGETSVVVRGSGRGGRNVEYLLALAIGLRRAPGVYAIAGDTDGIDGIADNAGATIGPETLVRAHRAGLDPSRFLADNDGHTFFETLGDIVKTGPTFTNVNDFRAILVD